MRSSITCIAAMMVMTSIMVSSRSLIAKEKTETPREDRHGDPLPQGANARLGTVRFHNPGPIHTVAFSPDGTALLVFAERYRNSALRLWDIVEGKELARFDRKDASYAEAWYTRSVCFLPDGTGILLRRENVVELIDRQSGKSLYTLAAKEKYRASALSPDGKVVALAVPDSKKTTITYWEMATGKTRSPLTIDSDWFFGLHYSSDGKRLLTASADQKRERGIVQVWEVSSGKMLHRVAVDNYFYVAFSPDGRFVASRYDSGYRGPDVDPKDEIRVIRVDDGATVCRFKPPPNGSWASFAFTPDGKALIAIAPGQKPSLWDAATGKQIRTFAGPTAESVAMGGFSADGKRFALIVGGRYENSVRLWNVETGEEIRRFDGHADEITAVAYSPDGKILASGSYDCTVRLWDPRTGRELRCLQGHKERVLALAFSPDGGTLASASTDGTTRLWKVADGKELTKLDGPGQAGAASWSMFEREGMKLVFADDGKALFAIDDHVGYCAWNVATRRTLKRGKFGDDENRLIGLSADGGTTVTYSLKYTAPDALTLWDAATGKRERTLPRRLFDKKTYDLACVAAEMSRDGRLLAGSSRAITDFSPLSSLYGYPALRIWERLSGQEILRLDAFPKAMAFSFDGKLLAGNEGSTDPHGYGFWHPHMGSVYLWDTTTGERRQRFEHHAAEVRCIAFAPDGKTVASGSADHTVLIWDCSRALADIKPLLKPAPKELDAWWELLADATAIEARKAMAQLVQCPAAATNLLGDRLKPASTPDPEQLAALLRDLSSAKFATRDLASNTLVRLGDTGLPFLSKAISAAPDLETKRRLEQILDKATEIGFRKVRAVTVLEAIGDEGAIRVLETLAKGVPDSRQTIEARVALRRLAR